MSAERYKKWSRKRSLGFSTANFGLKERVSVDLVLEKSLDIGIKKFSLGKMPWYRSSFVLGHGFKLVGHLVVINVAHESLARLFCCVGDSVDT